VSPLRRGLPEGEEYPSMMLSVDIHKGPTFKAKNETLRLLRARLKSPTYWSFGAFTEFKV
jgi:hypothetical protein